MAVNYSPPVIPEIAKAYQNDPRTQLALEALKSGTSTDPVARGAYGYADGIARALRAVVGQWVNNQQQAKYGADQDQLLAERKARGVDGLSGAGAAVAPPPAPGGSPAAQAAPTAPPSAPPGPPGGAPPAVDQTGQINLPTSAIASALGAPPAAAASPATGGGPMGQSPFSAASSLPPVPIPQTPAPTPAPSSPTPDTPPAPPPAINTAIGQQPIPDAPAPVAKPVAPPAVGPTRSKLLDAAYRIMADANPYESATGQELYASGLSDQDKLNEAAAERQQRLNDMGYQSDLSNYTNAQEAARNDVYNTRQRIQSQNFQASQRSLQDAFEAGENAKNRAATAANEAANRASQEKIAGMRMSAQYGTTEGNDAINQAMADGRLDPMAVTTRNRASLGAFLAANPDANPLQIHAFALGSASEARATGTRVGATAVATSEVPSLAIAASKAHSALQAQGNFVPWNRAVQAWQNHTSSPQLTAAMVATDAVAKAYARSFGTGAVSVNAYKDAQAKLSNAWGTPGFDAALNQIVQTTNLERAGATAALNSTGKPVPKRNPGETVAQYLARTGG